MYSRGRVIIGIVVLCRAHTLLLFTLLFADALIGPGGRNHKKLQQRLRCIIHVGQDKIPRFIRLKGDYNYENTFDALAAICELEKVLLPLVSAKEEALLLYDLAQLNGYGERSCRRLSTFIRLSFHNELLWMNKVTFPHNFKKFSGLFVGRKGSGIQPILKQNHCRMEMVHGCGVVYGSRLANVEQCVERLQEQLRFAEKRFYESGK